MEEITGYVVAYYACFIQLVKDPSILDLRSNPFLMIVSVRLAQVFFAISLISWALQHFILGEFVTGRPPLWPEALPGKLLFAYACGIILLVAGISILTHWKPILTVTCAGMIILVWAALRNIYALIISLDYGIILTNTNKALTIGFGALLVASTFRDTEPTVTKSLLQRIIDRLAPLSKYFIGLFLLVSGIQHFLFASFVKFLVPAWIPFPEFWTYLAGVALIAGGLGIITNIQRKLAATLSGYMIFIWLIVLHIPRALGAEGNANEVTAVFEALATSSLLFIIAMTSNREQKDEDLSSR
ncbi:DoxX family membrane protein [Chryseolinea sp. H1M3-3]|uniref:DoxX family protein n=1 Tax=Chryseolinea sp. H1M3-3 TaxID=3034144 RepID=UPI0023EBD944|nr:DoxX family membrane protein [Chryseolinea sp. H1M3-3]